MYEEVEFLGEIVQEILDKGVENYLDLADEDHYTIAENILLLAEELEKRGV